MSYELLPVKPKDEEIADSYRMARKNQCESCDVKENKNLQDLLRGCEIGLCAKD